MNILVYSFKDKCIARPDTTINKNNDDFFLADSINDVFYTPIVFARVSNAGKAVGAEFVDRYFDAVGFGLFLYPAKGPKPCLAEGSVWDHSSLLPLPLYNKVTLEKEDNRFEIRRNGSVLFSTSMAGIREKLVKAITSCTSCTYARRGDYIAFELQDAQSICSRAEGKCHIIADYCDNEVMNFEIIY